MQVKRRAEEPKAPGQASIVGPQATSLEESGPGSSDVSRVRAAFMNIQAGITSELNALRPTGAITNKVKPSFHKYKRQLHSGLYKGLPEHIEHQDYHQPAAVAHQRHSSTGEETVPPIASLGPIGSKNIHLQQFLQQNQPAPVHRHHPGPTTQMEATQLTLMQEQAESLFGLKLTKE
jgi:hypothetical protein